jgi:hypothetical protein
MRLQSHYGSGRLVNHTAFGRDLRKAARRALVGHLDVYDFGFQDGGCAMFARALVIWSGGRLSMAGYALPRNRVQHVVARDMDLVLDSDGLATSFEGSRKMAVVEHCPGCFLVEDFVPAASPRIPWSEPGSQDIAAALAPTLPDPATMPWRQVA